MSRENKISLRSNHLCWKQCGLSLTSPPKGSHSVVSVASRPRAYLCDMRHSEGCVADPGGPTNGLLEYRLLPIFPHCFLNAMRWTALLHHTIYHQPKAAKPTNHNLEPRKPWAKGCFHAWRWLISENCDLSVGSWLSQSPLPWSFHAEYDTVRFEAPPNPVFKLEATNNLYKYFCEVLFGLPQSCP